MGAFTIGEVARRAAISIDTVRYYERRHLLPAPARRASGYRQYGDEDVQRLRFIRRANALGFALEDIRSLLDLSIDHERGVHGLRARTEAKLADIDARIAQLQKMRRGLRQLVADCPGSGALDHCPILAALGGKEPA